MWYKNKADCLSFPTMGEYFNFRWKGINTLKFVFINSHKFSDSRLDERAKDVPGHKYEGENRFNEEGGDETLHE